MQCIYVLTLLLVGSIYCQNEIIDNLQDITKNLDTIGKFSGVPGLENFNQSALPSLEEIVTAVREKCEKNGGPEAYTKLEAAKDELQEYIQTNFDFEKMQQELDEKRKTGSMEEVFAKYCEKSHFVQNNFKNVTEALENCLESEERVNMKIFLNVTESLLDFMCYRDGDRIALFVAEGGFDCIQSKRDGIEKCLNDTLHHRIPKDFSLNSLPTLSIDESVCNDYTKVQACTVTVLETCKDTTPANIVDAIFKFVRRATPCKNYPVPPSVFGAHRRVTRNSVGQQLGPLYMAYDQVKQKYEPHCEKNGGQNALVEFREAMSRVEFCLQTKIMTFRQQIEPMRGFPYDYFCTTLRRDIRSCLVNITDKIEACSSKAETYVPKLGLELYDSVYNFYCKDDAKSLKNFLNKQDTCINKAQNSTSYCVGKTKHVKAYATDAVVTKSELCSDLKIIRGCYKDIAIQTCPSNKVANEFAESLSDAIYAPCAASRITTNLIIFITIFFITKLF